MSKQNYLSRAEYRIYVGRLRELVMDGRKKEALVYFNGLEKRVQKMIEEKDKSLIRSASFCGM